MRYDWERYSRQSIDVASTLTALAFSAVKTTTKFGVRLKVCPLTAHLSVSSSH